MRSFLVVLVFGVLLTAISYAQDKNGKGCCSEEKSLSGLDKCSESSDASSISASENDQLASIQSDDKNKKVEKNIKNMDSKVKKEKSTSKSSDDGCCSSSNKKTTKNKSPKS